jgi:hypothetical protein
MFGWRKHSGGRPIRLAGKQGNPRINPSQVKFRRDAGHEHTTGKTETASQRYGEYL